MVHKVTIAISNERPFVGLNGLTDANSSSGKKSKVTEPPNDRQCREGRVNMDCADRMKHTKEDDTAPAIRGRDISPGRKRPELLKISHGIQEGWWL